MGNNCNGVNGQRHEYTYAGLVYSEGHQRPGSGAHEVIYEDWFYCTHCAEPKYQNQRCIGSSYEKRLDGSLPK